MPCRDWIDEEQQQKMQRLTQSNKDLRGRNDKLARMLCALCRRAIAIGMNDLINEDPELKDWWKEHVRLDRLQKEEEARIKAAKEARKNAEFEAAKKVVEEAGYKVTK